MIEPAPAPAVASATPLTPTRPAVRVLAAWSSPKPVQQRGWSHDPPFGTRRDLAPPDDTNWIDDPALELRAEGATAVVRAGGVAVAAVDLTTGAPTALPIDTVVPQRRPAPTTPVVRVARDGTRTRVAAVGRMSYTDTTSWATVGTRLYTGVDRPDATVVLDELGYAEDPQWSFDGRSLYAAGHRRRAPSTEDLSPAIDDSCLARVDVATWAVTHQRCELSALDERGQLRLSPDRTRAAWVHGRAEAPGLADVELIDLAAGTVLATTKATWVWPPAMIGAFAMLDEHDRLLMPTGRGLLVLDVATGTEHHIHLGDGPVAPLGAGSLRLADGAWLTVRATAGGALELIAVDIDAALAEAAVVPPAVLAEVPDPDAPSAAAAGQFWMEPTPCPRRTTLRTAPHAFGTERACVDRAGRRHGRYAVDDGDRPIARGQFARDRMDGTWTWWTRDGIALARYELTAGVASGVTTSWFRGGALAKRVHHGDERFGSTSSGPSIDLGRHPNGTVAWRAQTLGPRTIRTEWNDRGDELRRTEYLKVPTGREEIETRPRPDGRTQVTRKHFGPDSAWPLGDEVRTYRGDVLDGPAIDGDHTHPGTLRFHTRCFIAGVAHEGPCPDGTEPLR